MIEASATAALFVESVTRTVKLKVPAMVGTPESVPPIESDSPLGSAPALIDHEYGGTPPVAAKSTSE